MQKIYFSVIALILLISSTHAQTTYKDVAPIFYAKCTSCHNNNGGHGQYASFLNYSQTQPHFSSIYAYLNSGKMPPWSPDTTYSRFLHERTITPAEKATIMNWINAGAVKGDTTLAPPAPVYSNNNHQLKGIADLEITIPTFTSNASSDDSYVCFSLPTGLTQDRYLRAYEVIPGNPEIVHHVIVNVDTIGTTTSDLSGGCYNITGDFSIGGFAPGSAPTIFPGQAPLKLGVRIKAGSKIVLQIHYPKGSSGETDSTKIRMYFYPTNETADIRPVYSDTPLQNWNLYLPANTVKTYTSTYPSGGMPIDISLFAAFPHSHKLATSIVNYAYLGADTIPLIRINKWDFNWQGYYTFKHMPKIPTGYKIKTQHVYDNTVNNPNNPSNPPVLVVAGTSTTDEMLFDSFQYLAYEPGDELIDLNTLLENDPLLVSSTKVIPAIAKKEFKTYAFPNPFEQSVRIGYTLESVSSVSIDIYSIIGSRVRQLQNTIESVGAHEVVWDGKGNNGSILPSGSYIYRITAGDKQVSGKLNLLPSKN